MQFSSFQAASNRKSIRHVVTKACIICPLFFNRCFYNGLRFSPSFSHIFIESKGFLPAHSVEKADKSAHFFVGSPNQKSLGSSKH